MQTDPPRPSYSVLPEPSGLGNLRRSQNALPTIVTPRSRSQDLPRDRVSREEALIQRHLQRGIEHYDNNRFSAAINDYSRAISLMEAQHRRAPVLRNEERQSAIDITDLHPDLGRVHYNRGIAYEQLGPSGRTPAARKQLMESALRDLQVSRSLTDDPATQATRDERIRAVETYLQEEGLTTPAVQPAPRPPTP